MKDVLNSAVHEIRDLRRRNEILSAQMGVVEVFAAALGLKHGEGGMVPDVAWQLEREIEKIVNEEKRSSVPTSIFDPSLGGALMGRTFSPEEAQAIVDQIRGAVHGVWIPK